MKRSLTTFILGVMMMSAPAHAAIETKIVTYQAGSVTARGMLVYDTKFKGKRPGVLVVPEWWGLNDYAKMRAEMLARLGYVAFAADMYGDGKVVDTADEAGKLAGPLKGGDRAEMRARVTAAFEQLKAQEQVDSGKIAAIGFCFGGTTVLELARSGADPKGVVTFHGGLDLGNAPAPKVISPKILILHGAADPMVPPDQVKTATDELDAAAADWQLISYSGAEHAFTNPKADSHNIPGVKYDKQADERSWIAMKNFLAEVFK